MNNQNKITFFAKTLVVVLVLFLALPALAAWQDPVSAPPNCDPATDGDGCYSPVNVSPNLQTKPGILELGVFGAVPDYLKGVLKLTAEQISFIISAAENRIFSDSGSLYIFGDKGTNANRRNVKIYDDLNVVGTTTTQTLVVNGTTTFNGGVQVCTGAGSCSSITNGGGQWVSAGTNMINYPGTRVGIRSSSPLSTLDVRGNAMVAGSGSRLTLGGVDPSTNLTWQLDNSAGLFRVFSQPNMSTGGQVAMSISPVAGTPVTYNTNFVGKVTATGDICTTATSPAKCLSSAGTGSGNLPAGQESGETLSYNKAANAWQLNKVLKSFSTGVKIYDPSIVYPEGGGGFSLDVIGKSIFEDIVTLVNGLILSPNSNTTGDLYFLGTYNKGTNGAPDYGIGQSNVNLGGARNATQISDYSGLVLSTGLASRLVVNQAGNVGIGTNSPTAKLDVAGKINASGDICSSGTGVCLSQVSTSTIPSGTADYQTVRWNNSSKKWLPNSYLKVGDNYGQVTMGSNLIPNADYNLYSLKTERGIKTGGSLSAGGPVSGTQGLFTDSAIWPTPGTGIYFAYESGTNGAKIVQHLSGYSTDALDIVGAGPNTSNRKVNIWDNLKVAATTTTTNLVVTGTTNINSSNFNICTGGSCNSITNVLGGNKWSSTTAPAAAGIYYSGGNVGIGKNNPKTLLDVYGPITASSLIATNVYFDNGNANDQTRIVPQPAGLLYQLNKSNAVIFAANGGLTNGQISFHPNLTATEAQIETQDRDLVLNPRFGSVSSPTPGKVIIQGKDKLCLGGSADTNCKEDWSSVGSDKWASTTAGNGISYTAGSVGIGTVSPDSNLKVESGVAGGAVRIAARNTNSTGFSSLRLENDGSAVSAIAYNGSGMASPFANSLTITNANSAGDTVFVNGGGSGATYERMRITSGGGVGIGSTVPAAKLDVRGQVRIEGSNTRLTLPSSAGSNMWNIDNNGGLLRIFRDDYVSSGTGSNGSVKMSIDNTGATNFYGKVTSSGDICSTVAPGSAANPNCLSRLSPSDWKSGVTSDGAAKLTYSLNPVVVGANTAVRGSMFVVGPGVTYLDSLKVGPTNFSFSGNTVANYIKSDKNLFINISDGTGFTLIGKNKNTVIGSVGDGTGKLGVGMVPDVAWPNGPKVQVGGGIQSSGDISSLGGINAVGNIKTNGGISLYATNVAGLLPQISTGLLLAIDKATGAVGKANLAPVDANTKLVAVNSSTGVVGTASTVSNYNLGNLVIRCSYTCWDGSKTVNPCPISRQDMVDNYGCLSSQPINGSNALEMTCPSGYAPISGGVSCGHYGNRSRIEQNSLAPDNINIWRVNCQEDVGAAYIGCMRQ